MRVSGHVNAPAGVSRFCLTTSTAPAMPASCAQADSLDSTGNFFNLTVPGLVPGPNTITAWIEDGTLRTASDSVPIDIAQVNLSATNLEVTQAIQNQVPTVSTPPGGPRTATYNGVPLAVGDATVARFWTGVDLGTGSGTLTSVHALLYGSRGGVSLGDPITPIEGASNLGTGNSVLPPGPTLTQRSDGTSQAFTFRLPASWTRGNVTLEAVVNPASAHTVTECGGCESDRLDRSRGRRLHPCAQRVDLADRDVHPQRRRRHRTPARRLERRLRRHAVPGRGRRLPGSDRHQRRRRCG